MTKNYCMCKITQEGWTHFIQGSLRLAEMLQTHKQLLTCLYFLGAEMVNSP